MTPYAQMIGSQMRPEAQATYAYEYQRFSKDPNIALALTLTLGVLGGESYYIGDWKRGVLFSLAVFTGIGLFITVPMWIVRCFTIQNECEAHNDYLAYCLAFRYGPMAFAGSTVPEPPASPVQPQRATRPPAGGVPMVARTV